MLGNKISGFNQCIFWEKNNGIGYSGEKTSTADVSSSSHPHLIVLNLLNYVASFDVSRQTSFTQTLMGINISSVLFRSCLTNFSVVLDCCWFSCACVDAHHSASADSQLKLTVERGNFGFFDVYRVSHRDIVYLAVP